MLDDMLCDIVAVLITYEILCATMELLQDRGSGGLDTVFQHALYDPAAICMLRKLVDLPGERVDNKLNMLGWYALYGLLHDVVSVLILDASHDLLILLELSNK